MIESNRLDEFVDTLLEQDNEDKMWELYLHTVLVSRLSYNEFKQPAKVQEVTHEELEATVERTKNILNNFNPHKGGE